MTTEKRNMLAHMIYGTGSGIMPCHEIFKCAIRDHTYDYNNYFHSMSPDIPHSAKDDLAGDGVMLPKDNFLRGVRRHL